jgi:hypothetical protein
VRRLIAALAVIVAAGATAATASASWTYVGTNVVASTPTNGAGYPVPPGSRVPEAGTCRLGPFNANHSESWIAVKPGTEDLVGSSKFFFDKYSTFYMFYLGAHQILNGTPVSNNQIQGYDCLSTGTGGQLNQDMPPSWTDTTDPNLDFDTQGRVYQTMLPFNSFFDATKLHPDGEIDVSFSDDLGRHWVKGNGGKALEPPNNASAKQLGHVEDKQWIAVNHIVGNINQDHVYAAWSVFNGNGGQIKVRLAVSRDRGQTFDKAVTISPPSEVGPAVTFVYPEIDSAGFVYVSVVSFPPNGGSSTIYVARSTDDARTFTPFVPITTVTQAPGEVLPNTRFRTGIAENFAASPTFPGHLYLTYEDWDGTQMDVKFTQSTDGGFSWKTPVVVNDNVDAPGVPTDQFQPSVAAGPGGAVAIEFLDRREACPNDPSVLPLDVGRTNFCIDATLQAYKDSGSATDGAVKLGSNLRVTEFTWDPEQPGQRLGGLSQYPCAGARDPCPNGRGFIGDYFGLAISAGNIYGLFPSTHYAAPDVVGDGGGPIFYQQQVLSKVPRSAIPGL